MDDHVLFISLEGRDNFLLGEFSVRDDVPLPFYVANPSHVTQDDISPDAIIRGLIMVLSDEPEHEHFDYYRDLLLKVHPEVEEEFSKLAFVAVDSGDYEEALQFYNLLLAINPFSRDHMLHIAICYDEFAQDLFAKGLEEDALKVEDEAFSWYKKLEDDPEPDEEMLYYLGRFYLIRENYARAVEYFQKYMQIATDPDTREEVGTVLQEILETGVDNEDYESILELIHSDKDEDALGYITLFIEKYPTSWNGYYLKGLVYRKLGNYAEAVPLLEKALSLNTESADIYNELGLVSLNMGVFHKAEMYFGRALRFYPDDIAILGNLAVVQYRKGDFEEAIKYCDIILDSHPKDSYTKNLRAIIEEEMKKK